MKLNFNVLPTIWDRTVTVFLLLIFHVNCLPSCEKYQALYSLKLKIDVHNLLLSAVVIVL